MNLFVEGKFRSHSGLTLPFKVECDALTDDDLATIARYAAHELLPYFGDVVGVPRGGLRLAEAFRPYCNNPNIFPLLIVDDVWTTGRSMLDFRSAQPPSPGGSVGFVIFARGDYENHGWVTAMWKQASRRYMRSYGIR